MHKVLQEICAELGQIITQMRTAIPSDEPMGNAHNNWSFPGVTRTELIGEAESLSNDIRERGPNELSDDAERGLRDYIRRLQFFRNNTLPNMWGNAGVAVPTYLVTLEFLRRAVAPFYIDTKDDASRTLRRVTVQIRAMEARLKELEPRSANLNAMVQRIETAHETADQLPTDLQSLAEAREQVEKALRSSQQDGLAIAASREAASQYEKGLEKSATEAEAIVARCESAYAVATSQGLAAAFLERSRALDRSMWAWVAGLIVALVLGATSGSHQLGNLLEQLKVPAGDALITSHLVLALLSVGGPVWFAWLATKQIGQRFRLSEDYAFKAAVSRAYEGYRREAAQIDKDLEVSLLASALSRLDELPLRLVEAASHGSPGHELASSPVIKDAIKSIPNFTSQITEFAHQALSKVGRNSPTTRGSAPPAEDS